MVDENGITTITLKRDTKERLNKHVQYPDSMDDTLNRLLDTLEDKK